MGRYGRPPSTPTPLPRKRGEGRKARAPTTQVRPTKAEGRENQGEAKASPLQKTTEFQLVHLVLRCPRPESRSGCGLSCPEKNGANRSGFTEKSVEPGAANFVNFAGMPRCRRFTGTSANFRQGFDRLQDLESHPPLGNPDRGKPRSTSQF